MRNTISSIVFFLLAQVLWAQVAHQSEYLPMAKEKSVQDLFISQLTDVVGEENTGTWTVSSSPVQTTKKDFTAFSNIFLNNCQSLTATGTAKSKYGKVQSEVKITKSGTDPIVFKIVVTATKDLVVKKVTKSVSVDIHLNLNATPKETRSQLGVAIIRLKGRAANLAESEIAKKVQAYVKEVSLSNMDWGRMLAFLNYLLVPVAQAHEALDFESQELISTIKIAEILMYASSYTSFREVYKTSRDIEELESYLRLDFKKMNQF